MVLDFQGDGHWSYMLGRKVGTVWVVGQNPNEPNVHHVIGCNYYGRQLCSKLVYNFIFDNTKYDKMETTMKLSTN